MRTELENFQVPSTNPIEITYTSKVVLPGQGESIDRLGEWQMDEGGGTVDPWGNAELMELPARGPSLKIVPNLPGRRDLRSQFETWERVRLNLSGGYYSESGWPEYHEARLENPNEVVRSLKSLLVKLLRRKEKPSKPESK